MVQIVAERSARTIAKVTPARADDAVRTSEVPGAMLGSYYGLTARRILGKRLDLDTSGYLAGVEMTAINSRK